MTDTDRHVYGTVITDEPVPGFDSRLTQLITGRLRLLSPAEAKQHGTYPPRGDRWLIEAASDEAGSAVIVTESRVWQVCSHEPGAVVGEPLHAQGEGGGLMALGRGAAT